MKKIFPILAFLILAVPSVGRGGEAIEVLKVHIDQVVNILSDPQYQKPSLEHLRQEKVWDVIRQVFDFREMARRALARNWKRFTPEEQEAFSSVFTEFLGNNYLGRINAYRNEKVAYIEQTTITDAKALVNTAVKREGTEISVVYKMLKSDGSWKIYDVQVEGVSLVKNYRAQFRKILSKKSPAQLIKMLENKIDKDKGRSG